MFATTLTDVSSISTPLNLSMFNFSPSLIVPLATIRDPTSKCTSIKKRDIVNNTDKELWEYFADSLKEHQRTVAKTGKLGSTLWH
jgi:hypothetical protein